MARADLLVKLVKAGGEGNKVFFSKIVESLIAEEKGKQHYILANQLEKELKILSKKENSTITNLSNLFVTHPENLDSYLLSIDPKKSFNDIILDEKVRAQIDEFISEHHRKDLLHSFNLEPRNRILLVGSPGNGKTSVAEAIAGELMLPFYLIRYDGIIGSYLGETATRLKRTFDFLRTQDCVVFFDEFDAIGKERGDVHETGEIKRVVNSLLLQIDRLPSYVTIIAATNHPELLDRAVWRRFQMRLELKKPTQQKIVLWLKKFEERLNKKLPIPLATLAKYLVTIQVE
ncbi:MAG: ATP-binding protein [Ginsengibacter sp.]